MADISFKIKNKKDDSSYRYIMYENGKKVKSGSATYTTWNENADAQIAWVDAVNAYNVEQGNETPSSKMKKSIQELEEVFKKSGDNIPEDLLSDILNIAGAVATYKTNPVKFVDYLISACKSGPINPKDIITSLITTTKTNLINKGKRMAGDYGVLTKVYVEPITASLDEYTAHLNELDAAEEELRKKYAEELYAFNIVISETNPLENVRISTDIPTAAEYNESNSDPFYDLSTIGYSNTKLPESLQNQANNAFIARFGSGDVPADIKTRYTQFKKDYFDNIFKDKNVPIQMSLLSIIETGCSTEYGKNENSATARGMWQIIRPTGSDYKLLTGYWEKGKSKQNNHNFKITSSYDYRTDVEKATNAAAKVLSDMHRLYAKTWILAAACYNWGPGNVQKVIKKYGYNIIDLLPHFPAETRNYCLLLIKLTQLFGMSIYFMNE